MSTVIATAATTPTPAQRIHFLQFIQFPLVSSYFDAGYVGFAVRFPDRGVLLYGSCPCI